MDRRQEDEIMEERQLRYLGVHICWSTAEWIYQLHCCAKSSKVRGRYS
jgi:hypothetical protein